METSAAWHCSQAPSSSTWALNWRLPRTFRSAVRSVEASPPVCVHLLSFWLSESTLSCPNLAWKCSLSLNQVPLLCSSVTFSLHPSPAQPKMLVPKLLLFHIDLITPDLYVPRGVRCVRFTVSCVWLSVLVFSVSNFTPLSYLILMAWHSSALETFLALAFVLLHAVCQALLMPHLLLTLISFSSTVCGHIASSAVS